MQSESADSRKVEHHKTDLDATQIEATDHDQTEHALSGTDINRFVNFTLKNGNLFRKVEIVAATSGESSPVSGHRMLAGPLPVETMDMTMKRPHNT